MSHSGCKIYVANRDKLLCNAGMAKLADAADLKPQWFAYSSCYVPVNNNFIDMISKRE
jgi:hypothetical protein